MSTYNDSGIIIPQSPATKASKIEALKPTNGDGDLDFTRNSLATRVNSDGLLEEVAINIPRLDYSNSATCPSLLLEPQSTNLITYPLSFDNAYWVKSGLSVVSNQSSPHVDYPTSAYKLVEDSSTGVHQIASTPISITIGSRYVQSFYLRAGERSIVQIAFGSQFSSTDYANFDLLNGVVSLEVGDIGADIEELSNGWYRCSVYSTSLSTTTEVFYLTTQTSLTATRFDTYTGDGVSGVYVFGAQVENQIYLTSLILPSTEGVVSTRIMDFARKTGITSYIGQTEGVLIVDFIFKGVPNGVSSMPVSIDGIGGVEAYIYIDSSNIVYGQFSVSGFTCNINGGSLAIGQRYKIAFAYKQDDFSLHINGVTVGTDNSGAVGATQNLTIGNYLNGNYPHNNITEFRALPNRPSNEYLNELTTL